jgi:3-hexulose-6-phosphate synthase/6-phospho-3-hexuloisomerase
VLQIAIDEALMLAAAVELAAVVAPAVERVEAGTPLLFRFGVDVVRELAQLPGVEVVADLKIVDAGRSEAELAFAAGAGAVTVLAVADDATVLGALAAARDAGGRVIADLISAPDPLTRACRLKDLGVDELCVHTGIDRQGIDSPLAVLRLLAGRVPGPLAVAGGITAETAAEVVAAGADVLVVGGAVSRAADPVAAVAAISAAAGRP